MVCICLKLGLNMQEQHHFFFTVKWKPVGTLDHVPGEKFQNKGQVKLCNVHSLYWQLPSSQGDACGHSRRAQSATRPLRRPRITLTAIKQRGRTEQRVQQFSVQLNFFKRGGRICQEWSHCLGASAGTWLASVRVVLWKTVVLRRKWIWFSEERVGKNNHE